MLGGHGEALGSLRCPSLVIWGTQDPYVGIAEMDVLAAAVGGPTRTLPVEGGHWPMSDTDEAFDATVAFLVDPDAA
ncbi:alpha/beta hydrolase [Patulibacter sp. NPDC049589]|uniref:alpha/beta fold hydrolase n=1 Tax=Patulibacter sp. NPDC049589 TaxID=3154731 RepID=UPI00342380D0